MKLIWNAGLFILQIYPIAFAGVTTVLAIGPTNCRYPMTRAEVFFSARQVGCYFHEPLRQAKRYLSEPLLKGQS